MFLEKSPPKNGNKENETICFSQILIISYKTLFDRKRSYLPYRLHKVLVGFENRLFS